MSKIQLFPLLIICLFYSCGDKEEYPDADYHDSPVQVRILSQRIINYKESSHYAHPPYPSLILLLEVRNLRKRHIVFCPSSEDELVLFSTEDIPLDSSSARFSFVLPPYQIDTIHGVVFLPKVEDIPDLEAYAPFKLVYKKLTTNCDVQQLFRNHLYGKIENLNELKYEVVRHLTAIPTEQTVLKWK